MLGSTRPPPAGVRGHMVNGSPRGRGCSDSLGVPSLSLSSVLLHEPCIVFLCSLFCLSVDSSTRSCATEFPERPCVTQAGRPPSLTSRTSARIFSRRGRRALCVAQSLIRMR